MANSHQEERTRGIDHSDWSLTPEQMLLMLQSHNAIEAAFEQDDLEFLRQFASNHEFKMLFGDMGFDEAYDRY